MFLSHKKALVFSAACAVFSSFEASSKEFIEGYNQDFLELLQMVYGEGFLSQGAADYALPQMFDNEALDDKKVLDVGCGLGGIDFLIAEKYRAEITGVDPQAYLIRAAQESYEKKKMHFKGKIEFKVVPETKSLASFKDNSFDIVFSRESLLHIPEAEKKNYFKDIYRILKPSGKMVIVDWTHKTKNYSPTFKKMIEIDKLAFNLITPQEYKKMIMSVGFKNLSVRDDTPKYLELSQEDCQKLTDIQTQVIKRFGSETYDHALKSWKIQGSLFKTQEVIIGVYKAYKI
jgi:phosphoethanolamine N-methyltransferase